MRGKTSRLVSRRRFVMEGAVGMATFVLAGCSSEPQQEASQDELTMPYTMAKLAIVYTSDAHGHLVADDQSLGLAAVAALRDDYERQGYDVLLLDVGDVAYGNNLVNRSRGDVAISLMNEAGYDAMALGNHEFDYGQNKLGDYAHAATFPLLCANAIDATGATVVDPSKVFVLSDGRKIGVFGLVTPQTATKVNPLLVQGVTFLEGDELYACAQSQVDVLRSQQCDLVVCLGHLGERDTDAPNRAQDVIAHVGGIDVFIDAHDHEQREQVVPDAEGWATLLVEAGAYLGAVGVVTWKDQELLNTVVSVGDYADEDKDVAQVVSYEDRKVRTELDKIVGTTPFVLEGGLEGGAGVGETNLGDLVTDAMLWQAGHNSDNAPDLALLDARSFAGSFAEGDMTLGDVLSTLPGLDYLCTVRVSGEQLLEALEVACSALPEASDSFPQAAGMEFSVDATTSYQSGKKYEGLDLAMPAKPGARVSIAKVGDKRFDPKASYVVASSDRVCAGVGSYRAFFEAAQTSLKGAGGLVSDSLVSYLSDRLDAVVPKRYKQPQGRIEVRT